MPVLPKKINRLIGRAMHIYSMLSDGDRVIVAVSGGIDSLALAWVLNHWRKKAPIHYDLLAIHLDMGFENETYGDVEREIKKIDIPFLIERTTYGVEAYHSDSQSACFNCSKKRRNRLFTLAKEQQYNKIALGHHKDDIIETLFLNMCYSGNISTMVPKQGLFDGKLELIRPLAFLEKSQVIQIARAANLDAVKNPCPNADKSKREEIRTMLNTLFKQNPEFKNNIFASLANVREDYLLKKMVKG